MVDTSVLLTAVLAAFAVLGGAFSALAARIGGEVRDLAGRLDRSDDRLTSSRSAPTTGSPRGSTPSTSA